MNVQPARPRRRTLVHLLAGTVLVAPLFCGRAAAQTPGAAAPADAPRFAPGVYRGRLGTREIQMQLKLDPTAEDSVEGSYFVFGDGREILLAGEFDHGELSMEESINGHDVSGLWSARIGAGHLAGTWTDADERQRVDFDLALIAP